MDNSSDSWALGESRVISENHENSIKTIIQNRTQNTKGIGWELERFKGALSVYVSADAILALVSVHRFDEAKDALNSLQNAQNTEDWGWGAYFAK
jgi:hypothetical protein